MAAPRSLLIALLAAALVAGAVPGRAQTQSEVDRAEQRSDAADRAAADAATDRIAAQAALVEGLDTYEAVNRELEALGLELADQRVELVELEDGVRRLRRQAQEVAVAAYMSGGDLDSSFGTDLGYQALVARHLAAAASDFNRGRLEDLAASRTELNARRAAFDREEDRVRELRTEVEASVQALDRLFDDAGYRLDDAIAAVAEADRRYRLEVVRFEEEERRLAALGGVARWRPLVERYFPAHLVTDALRIMHCESRGNPDATNPTSDAAGLFQFLAGTWAFASVQAGFAGASRYDSEANVASAAWLVDFSIRTNHPYGTWGRWECRFVLGG